jgi:Kef-type K+ transport system membrane component KefB
MGVALRLAGGLLLGAVLPASDLMQPERRPLFALFLGVAFSISALPAIAKTLLGLGISNTEVGLLVMASAAIDDIVGWVGFSVRVAPLRGGAVDFAGTCRIVARTVGFVLPMGILGRRFVAVILRKLHADPDPGGSSRRSCSWRFSPPASLSGQEFTPSSVGWSSGF